jgi:hypothetical protein
MGPVSERGQVLADRYRLVQVHAEESEMEVWSADDLRLERRVRLEMPGQPSAAVDEALLHRFWATARGPQPVGGARVLDAGTDAASGQVFLVREWRDDTPVARPAGAPAQRRPASTAGDHSQTPRPAVRTGHSWRPGRWPIIGGAIAALALGGYFFGTGISAWLSWINEPLAQQRTAFSLAFPPAVQVPAVGAQSGQATVTPVAPPPTVAPRAVVVTPTSAAVATAGPNATPARGSTPTASTSAQGNRRRIVNTDGQGVALRTSPGGDRVPAKGYDEGASVTVLERNGPWTHIRGDDGRDGWIPTVTIAP